MKLMKTAITLSLIATLAACGAVEPRHSGNVYGVNAMNTVQHTAGAQIMDIKDAYVQSENGNVIVGALGAIAGGVISKNIGKGTGNDIARVMGAIIGGYGANEVYRQYGSTRKVKQFTLKLSNGSIVTILQDAGNEFQIGEYVKVIGYGNKLKISK